MILMYNRLEQWKDRERLAQQKKQQLNMEIDRLNHKITNQSSVIKELESSLERLESVLNQLQSGNDHTMKKLICRIGE
jgi:predicted  nucleic acid-binding Zn-ribbon protein